MDNGISDGPGAAPGMSISPELSAQRIRPAMYGRFPMNQMTRWMLDLM